MAKTKTNTANPSTPTEDYMQMQERFALPVALLQGTLAMRAQSTAYMPQYPSEGDERYARRVKNSVLLESFRKSVDNLSSRPFAKEITIDEDAGDMWSEFVSNVDHAGSSLTSFAKGQLEDMLTFGKSHILVDFPDTERLKAELSKDQLTKADENEFNLRPYFSHISPASVIGWLSKRVGGVEVLEQVRFIETSFERVDEWEEKEVSRVHVWTSEKIDTYRKLDKNTDEWPLESTRPNTLGFIPLITIYANRKGFLKAFPPMEGLAHLNQKHWWMQSDQDQIETVARVPMLFFRGFDVEKLAAVEVGPYKIFGNRAHESDIKVVETSGKAVEVGAHALGRLEKQMQAMSMEPLQRKPQQVTATEMVLDEQRNMSDLEAYVVRLEKGLRDGLKIVAMWKKIDPKAVPAVNIAKDDALAMGGDRELEEMRLDYTMGVIDQRTYLEHRKARGLYSEDMDIDEVIDRASQEEGDELEPANSADPID